MRVLVVGAGILGASAAYHLASLGVQVDIVDESHQGKATMAGAGIICPWATKIDEPEWYRMYASGARYYETLIAGLTARGERDLGYGKVGALVVAEDPAELEAARARIARRVAQAPRPGPSATSRLPRRGPCSRRYGTTWKRSTSPAAPGSMPGCSPPG